METSNYTVRVLTPSNESGYLTQSAEVNVEDRILSKKVFLAINDSESNWKEISKEEGDAIKEQQEQLRNEKLNNNK